MPDRSIGSPALNRASRPRTDNRLHDHEEDVTDWIEHDTDGADTDLRDASSAIDGMRSIPARDFMMLQMIGRVAPDRSLQEAGN